MDSNVPLSCYTSRFNCFCGKDDCAGSYRKKCRMKTVLITGCSSGFGFELVSRYLAKGWKVYATMRAAKDRSTLFQKEQEKYPNQLFVLNLDITSNEDREKIVKTFEESETGLNCLVNNAGFGLFGALED